MKAITLIVALLTILVGCDVATAPVNNWGEIAGSWIGEAFDRHNSVQPMELDITATGYLTADFPEDGFTIQGDATYENGVITLNGWTCEARFEFAGVYNRSDGVIDGSFILYNHGTHYDYTFTTHRR